MATTLGTALGVTAGALTAWGALHFGAEADRSYYAMRDAQAGATCIETYGGTADSQDCWEYPDSVTSYQDQAGAAGHNSLIEGLEAGGILALGGAATTAFFRMRRR